MPSIQAYYCRLRTNSVIEKNFVTSNLVTSKCGGHGWISFHIVEEDSRDKHRGNWRKDMSHLRFMTAVLCKAVVGFKLSLIRVHCSMSSLNLVG